MLIVVASLLIIINAALYITTSLLELDLLARYFSCNRLNVSEKKCWSGRLVFAIIVHKHCSQTSFTNCDQSVLFANTDRLALYSPEHYDCDCNKAQNHDTPVHIVHKNVLTFL
jgi:hypothetical protein